MSATRFLSGASLILRTQAKRNISATPVVLAKATDPIQQLFVDKLKDYNSRSGKGAKLVDPTPEIEKEYKQELSRLAKHFGGSEGEDMTKFPEFKFQDPKIDSINLEE